MLRRAAGTMKRVFEIDTATWLFRGIFTGADTINIRPFNFAIRNLPAGHIGRPSGLEMARVAIGATLELPPKCRRPG